VSSCDKSAFGPGGREIVVVLGAALDDVDEDALPPVVPALLAGLELEQAALTSATDIHTAPSTTRAFR
jgi:hypothetical protein